jgi:hypothetical protein
MGVSGLTIPMARGEQMGYCYTDHRHEGKLEALPIDQEGGDHPRCAGCAYERGLLEGLARNEALDIDLDSLPWSRAGAGRHRSPHAAWALGYLDGVRESYARPSQARAGERPT